MNSDELTRRSPNSETHCSVGALRKGDRINGTVLLVQDSNFKQTRDGKYFIQMVLRDRTGSVRAVRWEASHDLFASFSSTDFVQVTGRVEEFQQNLQVVVDKIKKVSPTDVDLADFLPTSVRSPDEMEQELLEHIAAMADPDLRALLVAIVEDPEIRPHLLRCPAGKTLHHAYLGGLLEHILSLINSAKLIVKNYPQLNVDLLVTAAVVHDLGKIQELSYERAFGYTDRGQLVGHIGLGILILAEKTQSLPNFPQDHRMHLEHIIASHHGELEFGALKVPMTSEAMAFHFIDNLDAKMAMLTDLERELRPSSSEPGGARWTEYKPALSRRIYFPCGSSAQ